MRRIGVTVALMFMTVFAVGTVTLRGDEMTLTGTVVTRPAV